VCIRGKVLLFSDHLITRDHKIFAPALGGLPRSALICANLRQKRFPITAMSCDDARSRPIPDTLLPVIQLFDLWVLRRLLETAAPGPNYLVLKHAILEPNGGPMEA
jgi:hypothetical protein